MYYKVSHLMEFLKMCDPDSSVEIEVEGGEAHSFRGPMTGFGVSVEVTEIVADGPNKTIHTKVLPTVTLLANDDF